MAELLLIFELRFRYFTAEKKRYAAICGGTLRIAAYLFFSAVKIIQMGKNLFPQTCENSLIHFYRIFLFECFNPLFF